jgi:hypothetical protein
MSERSLEQFHKGELVEGMVFHREPGEHIDAVQVNVTYDEYRQIQDQQTNPQIDPQQHGKYEPTMDNADLEGTGLRWVQSGGMGTPIECSLPEGAEWDVEYSLEQEFKQDGKWLGPTFADVYDITRATPNNMELGELIRKMVNDSDE